MYVLTALSQTLHLDLMRRGNGREGRMENVEKCKRMGKRRGEDERGEKQREQREKRMEGEERRKERKERHPLNFNFTI